MRNQFNNVVGLFVENDFGAFQAGADPGENEAELVVFDGDLVVGQNGLGHGRQLGPAGGGFGPESRGAGAGAGIPVRFGGSRRGLAIGRTGFRADGGALREVIQPDEDQHGHQDDAEHLVLHQPLVLIVIHPLFSLANRCWRRAVPFPAHRPGGSWAG